MANKFIGVTNEWKYLEIKCGNELDGERKTTKLVMKNEVSFFYAFSSLQFLICGVTVT